MCNGGVEGAAVSAVQDSIIALMRQRIQLRNLLREVCSRPNPLS